MQAVGCGIWLGWRTAKHDSYGYVEAALAALVVGALISGTTAVLLVAGNLAAENSFRASLTLALLGAPSALILRALIGMRVRKLDQTSQAETKP